MFAKIARSGGPRDGLCLTLLALGLAACASEQTQRYDRLDSAWQASARPARDNRHGREGKVYSAENTLDRAAFVRAVLERNPSLESSRQAWRAALAQHSQVSALDDPMLEYSFAPLSIASADVRYGQVVTLSQKLPWPGKRGLAGEVALAEAEAQAHNFEAVRLRLALTASVLFDQYYTIERSLELNEQHRALVEEIRAATQAQYEAGRASQQEPLQAEVELANVERQRIVLSSQRAIVVAQMNGLLHEHPESPLPPPPKALELPEAVPQTSAELQQEALAHRPELRAQHAEIQSREAARNLADRESYPDFGVMAQYNSMWAMPEHQWMVGFSLNVPLWTGKRRGGVEAAEAKIAQAKAELVSTRDAIRVDVEQARQRLLEAGQVARLYRDRLLPAARAQIEAAKSGYVTGQTSFQALIDAERSLRNEELAYQETLASVGERRAELLQALGRLPGLAEQGGKP